MQSFDLCVAWSWEYDADFIARLERACANRGLSCLQVTPATLPGTLAQLASGELSFSAFLDRASDGDAAFMPLVDWATAHADCLINPFAKARRAWDKATMHLEFITAGLYTPHTIIVPPYDDRPELQSPDLTPLGGRFSIKPAHGGGGVGVVNEAEAWTQVTAARQRFPADKYLLQEWITPAIIGGRRAWFRVIHCCGQTFPCWWDDRTHIYTPVTPSEEKLYNLSRLHEMACIIARVCGLQLFSTEIAWAVDGRLLSVDYVNDPLDLRLQSKALEGVPDQIVDSAADCIANWVAGCVRPQVRPANEFDVPMLMRLLEELGRPQATLANTRVAEVYRQHMVDPTQLVLVAELAGQMVGMLAGTLRTRLNWATRELWIADLVVTESVRNQGIGRALVSEAIARASKAGCHRVVIESASFEQAAHRFYQLMGFQGRGSVFMLELPGENPPPVA